jgi:hypothetical protein
MAAFAKSAGVGVTETGNKDHDLLDTDVPQPSFQKIL